MTFASTSPSICTTSGTNGGTLTIVAAGTCSLTADQAGDTTTQAAAQVTASIIINKATQTITGFTPPSTLSQAQGTTIGLTAVGGASGNPVTFASTTPSSCTTGGSNGATLTVQGSGNCSVTANQAGNDNYLAAPAVTVTISITVPAQLYFIHPDHLGTPRAITKSTDNTKVWEWKNDDPFGNNAPDENPNSANGTAAFKYNLRFPGQYFDEETNTHYNYFRDYDPSTGRYVQSDPIGLNGGVSTFAYADQNPLLLIDVFGLKATLQCKRCRKGNGSMLCSINEDGRDIGDITTNVGKNDTSKTPGDPYGVDGPLPPGKYSVPLAYSPRFERDLPSPTNTGVPSNVVTPLGTKRSGIRIHQGNYSKGCLTTGSGPAGGAAETNLTALVKRHSKTGGTDLYINEVECDGCCPK